MDEQQIYDRLEKVILKTSLSDVRHALSLEAQYLAERFADKDAENRATYVMCGLFLAMFCFAIWAVR